MVIRRIKILFHNVYKETLLIFRSKKLNIGKVFFFLIFFLSQFFYEVITQFLRWYLETFFKEYGKSVDQISSKYVKGRNILYVAVTRAIKNLRVLYIDDLEEIRDSMEKVFGKIYEFSNGITKEEF